MILQGLQGPGKLSKLWKPYALWFCFSGKLITCRTISICFHSHSPEIAVLGQGSISNAKSIGVLPAQPLSCYTKSSAGTSGCLHAFKLADLPGQGSCVFSLDGLSMDLETTGGSTLAFSTTRVERLQLLVLDVFFYHCIKKTLNFKMPYHLCVYLNKTMSVYFSTYFSSLLFIT